jgi:ATP-dependent DNA helicase PIF1
MVLSEEQLRAIRAVEDGKNVFITGSGGVGKSQVSKYIIASLKEKGKPFAVAAPTGIAAVPLGGVTMHSLLGVGPDEGSVDSIVSQISSNKEKLQKWCTMKTLLIDEISMMHPIFFCKCDKVARKLRSQSSLPFGGIQIVLVGDFFQLPPVDRDVPKDEKPSVEDAHPRFCFQVPVWKELNLVTIELTKIFRQKDQTFVAALQRARFGEHTRNDVDLLQSRVEAGLDCKDGIIPTRLYSYNVDVDKINTERLEELNGEEKTYRYTIHSRNSSNRNERSKDDKKHDKKIKSYINQILKKPPVEQVIRLKEDAQVVLLANIDIEQELVNGSRGIVGEFSPEGLPIVKFTNGVTREIRQHKWESKDFDVEIVYVQLPLKLAWALTIHRCQGMSLDRAIVSMRGIFSPGQAYVALSRIRTLEGLSLKDFDPRSIKAHPQVAHFYKCGYEPYQYLTPSLTNKKRRITESGEEKKETKKPKETKVRSEKEQKTQTEKTNTKRSNDHPKSSKQKQTKKPDTDIRQFIEQLRNMPHVPPRPEGTEGPKYATPIRQQFGPHQNRASSANPNKREVD